MLAIYGGRAYEPQVEALKKGVEVVVGTPGRLIDLAQQGLLDLGHVRSLVLDEADEMLDLGFLPDVEKIVRLIPAGPADHAVLGHHAGRDHHPGPRRTCTSPRTSARSTPTTTARPSRRSSSTSSGRTRWTRSRCWPGSCSPTGRGLTLVFCRTKRTAAKVADELADRGFASGAVHGDLGQGAREQALRAFRSGKVDVLVATDVAARGIDVEDITHVVNYQCPEDEKTYLHRIGRTARAGAKGIAITFVDWDDMPRWSLIDKALDLGFGEPEETYSTSDHFYEELDIPRDVTGVLPKRQADPGRAGRRGGRGPRRDRPGRWRAGAAVAHRRASARQRPRRRAGRAAGAAAPRAVPDPDPQRPARRGCGDDRCATRDRPASTTARRAATDRDAAVAVAAAVAARAGGTERAAPAEQA